jgi:hypothetical protein
MKNVLGLEKGFENFMGCLFGASEFLWKIIRVIDYKFLAVLNFKFFNPFWHFKIPQKIKM